MTSFLWLMWHGALNATVNQAATLALDVCPAQGRTLLLGTDRTTCNAKERSKNRGLQSHWVSDSPVA